MKFWIDAQLPPRLAHWLKSDFGLEAETLMSLGVRHAGDAEVFARLRAEGHVIITKDEDFVDLVTRLGPPPQVLWVTCGNVTNDPLRALFSRCFAEAISLLNGGEPIVEISDRERGRT